MKIIYNSVISLPAPSSINNLWNLGSILGLCLIMQLMTGIFLAMHYEDSVEHAFCSVSHICRDVNLGWLFRLAHANGASLFFICLYSHIFRGVYFGSFVFKFTWVSGVMIMLLLQATAFLGYVLPWGQMSFWGATVITNLLSSLPHVGEPMVLWLWGGFSVDNATLTRFFTLHYLLPFVIAGLVILHLLFLHQTGSNNPLGLKLNNDKIIFSPYFIEKDFLGYVGVFLLYFFLVLWYPLMLGDPENFLPADSLVTPAHIQPEWYFLFAYAILRAIPNKLGGVVGLVMAILIFMLLSFQSKSKFKSLSFYRFSKMFYFAFIFSVVMLTYIGAKPVEEPYVICGQALSVLYFSFFFFFNYLKSWEDKKI